MKQKRFIVLLLGAGLFACISCSSNESSSSYSKDSTNNSNQGLTPGVDQPNGSTYNPNQSPVDTVKTSKDSMRKKQ